MLKINKIFYYKYYKKVLEGNLVVSFRNVRGFGKVREGVVVWLYNYEYFYVDRMLDNGDMMLFFKIRKNDLYDVYVVEKIK